LDKKPDPILKIITAKRPGGVAQVSGRVPAYHMQNPMFKPQYHQKEKKIILLTNIAYLLSTAVTVVYNLFLDFFLLCN
jgi:hypothetical protein